MKLRPMNNVVIKPYSKQFAKKLYPEMDVDAMYEVWEIDDDDLVVLGHEKKYRLPEKYLKVVKTKVIFRTYKDGAGVVALLPEELATYSPKLECTCFVRLGGHSAADIDLVFKETRAATPEEYGAIRYAMESHYGYVLDIRKHQTYQMALERKKQFEKLVYEARNCKTVGDLWVLGGIPALVTHGIIPDPEKPVEEPLPRHY